MNQKLEAENVSVGLAVDLAWSQAKVQGLETKLAKVKRNL